MGERLKLKNHDADHPESCPWPEGCTCGAEVRAYRQAAAERIATLEANLKEAEASLCVQRDRAETFKRDWLRAAARASETEAREAAMRSALEGLLAKVGPHDGGPPGIGRFLVRDALRQILSPSSGSDHDARVRREERERVARYVELHWDQWISRAGLPDEIRALADHICALTKKGGETP